VITHTEIMPRLPGNQMDAWQDQRDVKNPIPALGASKDRRDAEFAEYVAGRMAAWRRVAYLLCQDWSRADDLVQGAITRLYVRWNLVRSADHIDAYARVVLVREFLRDKQSGWSQRVVLDGQPPDVPGRSTDHDSALDLRSALAALPPRQRATLVLRFYCDLSTDQTARVLGCSSGTVKSQAAKGLKSLRRLLQPGTGPGNASGSPMTRKSTTGSAISG